MNDEENLMAPNAVKKDVRKEKAKSLAREVEYAREGVENATIALENAKRAYTHARATFDERLQKLAAYASASEEIVPNAASTSA